MSKSGIIKAGAGVPSYTDFPDLGCTTGPYEQGILKEEVAANLNTYANSTYSIRLREESRMRVSVNRWLC
jgi:hypothetical protein